MLPWLVEAIQEKDTDLFDNMMAGMKARNDRFSLGVAYLVNRYDHYRPLPAEPLAPEDPLFQALSYFESEQYVLQEMDFIEPDSLETLPVHSTVPALILAGRLDPITPPTNGKTVHRNLSSSFYLEFPGTGHGVSRSVACAEAVMGQFLADPANRPSPACLEEGQEKPVVFLTDIYRNSKIATLARHILVEKN